MAAVPAHLRRYVVEQDYDQYTEMDHAVWRFVLLQTYARLSQTAHPAYQTGLADTGIRVDAIPRIAEMHDKLARFGWAAVCVDGFIPPRAFQGFQASRILPIAAEIRSASHLAYTPAPDIIHEAAGHAPILSEPGYAEFIRRFGAVAETAFGTPSDRAVYDAVHALSELKEDPASTERQIEAASRAVHTALANVSELSESARLARLYWWTAEYGLIGTPSDFKLYGAGLLSSLFESQSCLDPRVDKRVLSAEAVEVDYDITRPQPQLFVARDFEHLLSVLDEVSGDLSCHKPALDALPIAVRSEELATLSLDNGLEIAGTLRAFEARDGAALWIQLSGVTAFFVNGETLTEATCPNVYVLPQGVLRDGTPLSRMSSTYVKRATQAGVLRLQFRSGMSLSGSLRETHSEGDHAKWLWLEDFELSLPSGSVFRCRSPYPLALGEVVRVRAGAPAAYFAATSPAPSRVPRPRFFPPQERALLALYERAVASWKNLLGGALVRSFEEIARALDRDFPDDWLLRWNLLESLAKLGEHGVLNERLTRELERLEIKHLHREPIATGLAHIRALVQTAPEDAALRRNP